MGWTHGKNERWNINEKNRDKETRRFQKTRKTTAMMGGLCEDRSENGRGGRKVERKGEQHGPMETNYKTSCTASGVNIDQTLPYKGKQEKEQVKRHNQAVRGFAKKKNSKNPRLLGKWVGGWVRSHTDFLLLENRPKIALNQYWYIGVVYHVYSVCIYIAKSCLLLWFECSVQVSDGFPKKVWMGGWGELYTSFFGILGILLTLQRPLGGCWHQLMID